MTPLYPLPPAGVNTGEAIATYHPIPSSARLALKRRSSCSYECDDPALLVTWLTERGYTPIPTRSELEYARLQRRNELIVVFNTGTALCQGANAASAFRLLSELEVR